jgi:hypothetical protein
VGEAQGCIYIDLANDAWEAVEVTATGWRVISNPPVRFRRGRGMAPLPTLWRAGALKSCGLSSTYPDEDKGYWWYLGW